MQRTFSDNWYRIADLRIGLRPNVSVRLHHYRGEPWYVLHERAHAGFFRVNPVTYQFLARLTVDATLDEIWRAAVTEAPEETPGQEAVFELISALYRANLVYVEGGVDETKILERFARKKKKPLAARLSELLFMRIPLWDPDRWLSRRGKAIDLIFSQKAAWVAGGVFVWAMAEFFLAGSRAWTQAQHILQLNNLLLLYLAIFVSHFVHELAHAAACKRFGGEVRTMGVMLLLLTPLPYVDLSSSWTFRQRFQRAFVDAAGMLADLLTGAIATLVWAYSPPGVANELAYNLMFSTAIYTFIFNLNPLMRFDGYYILSDLIEIPNLHEQSKSQFQRWWNTQVLAMPAYQQEPISRRRQYGLIAFFLTSNVYRLMVMSGIVLFVADQYFGIGLIVALALAFTSFVQPLQRLLAPLKNPLFLFQQKRLVQRGGVAFALAVGLIFVMPLPESQILDGVIESSLDTPLFTESGGIVERLHVVSGQQVAAGDLVLELTNPELANELAGVEAQRLQAQVQEAKAISEDSVDLTPIRERQKTLDALKASLVRQQEALQVRAPHAGIWVAQELIHRQGNWLGRGNELGRLVDDRSHVFVGVIRQEAAISLADLNAKRSWVRIEGERQNEHPVTNLTLVPHSQKNLPSAALSPLAGGQVAVTTTDPSGKQAVEHFFLIRAVIAAESGRSAGEPFRAGRSAWIKVRLPARPLAMRAWQMASQYFQRRYQL